MQPPKYLEISFQSKARLVEMQSAIWPLPVNIEEKAPRSLFRHNIFCLDVVRMPCPTTNDYLDEYERELDEIVAACDGDPRSALRALMLVNEQLEQILNCLNAELVEHVSRHRRQTLH